MDTVVKTNGSEPNGSERRLRAILANKLETAIAAAWRECVEECATGRATPPLLDSVDPFVGPIFREVGWYYQLGDLEEYATGYLKPIAYREAKRLYRRYRLYQRPDARRWKAWLLRTAYNLYQKRVRGFDWDVANRLCELFSARCGIAFSYYLSDGKACFVVRDGEALGDDWETLYDDVVAGTHMGDFGYCRVLYAYSPSRRLLLCLHHTYVPIPSGGWALEWALYEEWEGIERTEAAIIALS